MYDKQILHSVMAHGAGLKLTAPPPSPALTLIQSLHTAQEFQYLTQSYHILSNGGNGYAENASASASSAGFGAGARAGSRSCTGTGAGTCHSGAHVWQNLRFVYDRLGHDMLRRAVHSAGLNTSHILIHIFMYYIMTTLYTYVFTFSADPSGKELQWCLIGLSGKYIVHRYIYTYTYLYNMK